MKVTVTKEFGSPEEAAAWLRIFSPAPAIPMPMTQMIPGEPISGAASNEPTPPTPEQKKPRKPRNDAGKPRGPYKTNGGPAASEPGDEGKGIPAVTPPAAPVSPTNTAGAVPEAGQAAAGGSPALTEADARAALKRINETPGLGMEAVMTHLRDFGTNRASLLKPEQYADFIKQADEKIAAVLAAAGRDAKAPK